MPPTSRRRLLQSVDVSSGTLAAGCPVAPSASTGTPAAEAELPATGGTDSESGHPTRAGAQLGRADVEIHPHKSTRFTDDVVRLRCTSVAAAAVRARVSDQVEAGRGISVGCGRSPIPETPVEESGFAVSVQPTTTYGRGGDLLEAPAVGYVRLRAVTPRTASATIRAGDREHTCTVPVYVLAEEAHVD